MATESFEQHLNPKKYLESTSLRLKKEGEIEEKNKGGYKKKFIFFGPNKGSRILSTQENGSELNIATEDVTKTKEKEERIVKDMDGNPMRIIVIEYDKIGKPKVVEYKDPKTKEVIREIKKNDYSEGFTDTEFGGVYKDSSGKLKSRNSNYYESGVARSSREYDKNGYLRREEKEFYEETNFDFGKFKTEAFGNKVGPNTIVSYNEDRSSFTVSTIDKKGKKTIQKEGKIEQEYSGNGEYEDKINVTLYDLQGGMEKIYRKDKNGRLEYEYESLKDKNGKRAKEVSTHYQYTKNERGYGEDKQEKSMKSTYTLENLGKEVVCDGEGRVLKIIEKNKKGDITSVIEPEGSSAFLYLTPSADLVRKNYKEKSYSENEENITSREKISRDSAEKIILKVKKEIEALEKTIKK